MFKKAKQRIVVYILSILCAVIVGTLAMIYIASYISVTSQNYEILEERTTNMIEGRIRDLKNEPEADIDKVGIRFDDFPRGQGKIKRGMEVNTFYIVKFDINENGLVLDNGADGLYSNEELINLAYKVRTKTKGKTGDLLYIVRKENSETYVSFMDNTVFTESFTKLFVFTLSFGMIALVVIAFISIKIANLIVSPMEETYIKQKQFTADAGHELKTPIAAIAANLDLLMREVGDNIWLDNIAYENERMKKLVTELLELAKNENKIVDKKKTDLSRLVNGALLPFEAAAFEKNILIESYIENEIMVNIDENSISQLVAILIDNALSHTMIKQGGNAKINVELSNNKGGPVLSVTNPGEEILVADREKIFERFYRADESHEYSGHYGLGLAIAKAIATANGAKISVDCHDELVTFMVSFSTK